MFQDERGHAMTTGSAAAAAAIDSAIHGFLHWKAAVMPDIKAALQADPAFGFGHVVNALLLLGARNAAYGGKVSAAPARATARDSATLPP